MTRTENITKPLYDKLKKAYRKAVKEKKESFEIVLTGENEQLWHTEYAKQVLQYLGPKFNNYK